MAITKKASAHWEGDLKTGIGSISTETGVLREAPYGFKARFEGGKGTNPEELIGAAHAGCFSMAFSMILGDAGLKADSIDTNAEVTLDQVEGGFAITAVKLILKAKIPGASQAQFEELSNKAKRRLPGFQSAECEDQPGCDSGQLDFGWRDKKIAAFRSSCMDRMTLRSSEGCDLFCAETKPDWHNCGRINDSS
jgi:osmotically inducible protein OsmC